MATSASPKRAGQSAIYLRCFPFDTWEMSCHRDALRRYALSLGCAEPFVLLDNGRSSRERLPGLERLFSLVAAGSCETVFVPGLWVFSLDAGVALSVARELRRRSCLVRELPRPGAPSKPTSAADRAGSAVRSGVAAPVPTGT